MRLPILLVALAFAGTFTFAPALRAQDAVAAVAPAELTASQILEKSRQTYAGFSVYKGTCSVVTDAVLAVGDGEPMQSVYGASAKIEFERGERLAIEGVDMGGNPIKALWTPQQAWIEMVVYDKDAPTPTPTGKTKRKIIEGNEVLKPIDSMLASLSGVTGGTGAKILNALVPDRFDLGNPFTRLGTAKLLAPKQLGTKICYVVQVTTAELNRVDTYWIERDSFLLRRLTEEIGEQRFDDMPEIEGAKMPMIRIAYSLSQFVFATSEAK